MARSADRIIRPATAAAVASLVAVTASCGVTTTQQKDDWLTVKAERTLVKSDKIDVGRPDPDVDVRGTTVIRGDKETAFAVELENETDHPVNDLPIAVGVEADEGKPVNLVKGSRYFEAHVPSLEPGEKRTWVFVTGAEVPKGEAFAKVGSQSEPALTEARSLPPITVADRTSGRTSGAIDLELSNESSIPQYDLEVYATARRDGKLVAAGSTSVAALEGGQSRPVKVALVGDAKGGRVDVFAPPTIFK